MLYRPKVLILSGDGINCERETANAFNFAGAKAKIIHINDLLAIPKSLLSYQILALPGGFSFGDELGSGKILSLKLKYGLKEELEEFISLKRPIIGICNGFQVLAKMGLLPFPSNLQTMSLIKNVQGTFIDKWVDLKVNQESCCKWTSKLNNIESIKLPVRHGEGRVIFKAHEDENHINLKQIPFRYEDEVNGSTFNIAGICDPTGTILGMMPHPEAALYQGITPNSKKHSQLPGIGAKIFESIIEYINKS